MEELKQKIEEIVNKIKGDNNLLNKFKENPVKTVEELIGTDLPDDQINNVVNVVKGKLNLDAGNDFLGKIKDLF